MKRKATITVESERTLVISGSHETAATLWCAACNVEVTMFGLNEAASYAALSHRALFHLAETGVIHFVETAEGKAMFCVRSLREQTEGRTVRLLNEERKD